MTTVWGIHNDTGLDLINGGFVSIGWEDLGDLRQLGVDKESVKQRLAATYVDAKPGAIPVWAGLVLRFAQEMQPGDYVVAPNRADSTLSIGRVSGDYYYEASAPLHQSRRPVTWLKTGLPRAGFSQAARYELGSALTLFKVKKHASEFLEALGAAAGPPAVDSTGTLSVEEATEAAETLPNARTIDQYTRDFVIDRLYTRLQGYEFEHFVAHLLTKMGYRTQVTQASGDGGIDVIAHKDALALEPPIIKVQCKKVIASMGAPDVQRLIGTLAPGGAEFGLFVALGSFTKEAQAVARGRQDLRLIGGTDLVSLIFEHYDEFDTRWKGLIPMRRVYVVDRDPVDV